LKLVVDYQSQPKTFPRINHSTNKMTSKSTSKSTSNTRVSTKKAAKRITLDVIGMSSQVNKEGEETATRLYADKTALKRKANGGTDKAAKKVKNNEAKCDKKLELTEADIAKISLVVFQMVKNALPVEDLQIMLEMYENDSTQSGDTDEGEATERTMSNAGMRLRKMLESIGKDANNVSII
jgi:hypothetical protein